MDTTNVLAIGDAEQPRANANTPANPADLTAQVNTDPVIYDHAVRVADAMQGAVLTNIDAWVEAASENKSRKLAVPAGNQTSWISSTVSVWIQRNKIFAVLIAFAMGLVALMIIRR